MALRSGTRLGVYEVIAQIGEGGMGQVYRARDTKLNRDVALKVLPDSFANDPERLARFTREAQTLAALNHPNIAHIYGLDRQERREGQDGGSAPFLVMELVEGDDLSQRIARGAIPLAEALPIAKQVAEALEAAHEQGIVHRDLKPANIKVRPDGTVKVLDFGLAKLTEASGSGLQASGVLTQSPTITSPAMTAAGVILGTAAYMSPEQAAGTAVDRRADIWSYGVVLWEMLSGRRLFGGETIVHTLADVLRSPITFDSVNAPAPIKTLLRRCLDRDVKTRLRDIGEARVTIARYLADPESVAEVTTGPTRTRWWGPWVVAAVLAAIAVAGWLRPRPAVTDTPTADLAFTIAPATGSLTPVGDLHATPEIAPDGSAVIFYRNTIRTGSGDGMQLQHLNALTPEPVRTGGFRNPGFWSPDSRSFVFSDGTNLKKMRVPDGAPELVGQFVPGMVGGSWSDAGTLLIAGAVAGVPGLFAVPAGGGVPKRLDLTLPEAIFACWPQFLPGNEDFLFLTTAMKPEESGIYFATLRDGRVADPVLLMKNGTAARYTPAGGGRILFVRNDNLYAQTLNRTARRLEGTPELIQQRVASSPAFWVAHFSVSRTGVVAWRPGTAGLSQVTTFDRQGKEIGTSGSPTVVQTLKLAPDETRLLIGWNGGKWLLEPGRPGQQPLEQGSMDLLWSQEGAEFLASSFDGKAMHLMKGPATGERAMREVAIPNGMGRLEDVSLDGKTLLFSHGPLDTEVFSFRLDGVQKTFTPLVKTGRETISHTRFSPDGRWIVYTASALGSERGGINSDGSTYVQPFPGRGLRKQVTSRGNYPIWRKDGKEIVYLDEHQGRDYVWSVPVSAPGGEFRAGTPVPLFPARLPATTWGDLNFLAVSRDGSRFYIPQAVGQLESDVIDVRIGWAK